VWLDAVVVAAPLLDQNLSLLETVEDLAVQELVPELCSDIPMRRQISPTVFPCASSTSASRRRWMICSNENRFLDICLPPSSQDPNFQFLT